MRKISPLKIGDRNRMPYTRREIKRGRRKTRKAIQYTQRGGGIPTAPASFSLVTMDPISATFTWTAGTGGSTGDSAGLAKGYRFAVTTGGITTYLPSSTTYYNSITALATQVPNMISVPLTPNTTYSSITMIANNDSGSSAASTAITNISIPPAATNYTVTIAGLNNTSGYVLGGTEFSRLATPNGLCADANNVVYVAEESANGGVRRITPLKTLVGSTYSTLWTNADFLTLDPGIPISGLTGGDTSINGTTISSPLDLTLSYGDLWPMYILDNKRVLTVSVNVCDSASIIINPYPYASTTTVRITPVNSAIITLPGISYSYPWGAHILVKGSTGSFKAQVTNTYTNNNLNVQVSFGGVTGTFTSPDVYTLYPIIAPSWVPIVNPVYYGMSGAIVLNPQPTTGGIVTIRPFPANVLFIPGMRVTVTAFNILTNPPTPTTNTFTAIVNAYYYNNASPNIVLGSIQNLTGTFTQSAMYFVNYTIDLTGIPSDRSYSSGMPVTVTSPSGFFTGRVASYSGTTLSVGSIATVAGKFTTASVYRVEVVTGISRLNLTALSGAPRALTVDSQNNVYVASGGTVLKINSTGAVTTLTGAGASAAVDGNFASARFNNLYGMHYDKKYNCLYVGDFSNRAIRRISLTPGAETVTTLGGSSAGGNTSGIGTLPNFLNVGGPTTDADGNVYVGDNASTIRKITPGGLTSVYSGVFNSQSSVDGTSTPSAIVSDGTTNGTTTMTSTTATYNSVRNMCYSPVGMLFAAQAGSHLIRLISPYPPNAPGPISVTTGAITGNSARFTWTADAAAMTYTITITPASTSYVIPSIAPGAGLRSMTITGLSDSSAYIMVIKVSNWYGDSSTPEISFNTPFVSTGITFNTPVPKSFALTGAPSSLVTASISWVGGAFRPPIVTYTCTPTSGAAVTGRVPTGQTSPFTITGLEPSTTYTLSVTGTLGTTTLTYAQLASGQSFTFTTQAVPQLYVGTLAGVTGTYTDWTNATATPSTNLTGTKLTGMRDIAKDAAGNMYLSSTTCILIIRPAAPPVNLYTFDATQTTPTPTAFSATTAGLPALPSGLPGSTIALYAGSTIAGNPSTTVQTGSAIAFKNITGMCYCQPLNCLFVADFESHVIVRVTLGTTPTAVVVAGVVGSSGNTDGVLNTNKLYNPLCLTVGPDNSLYICDMMNNRIRKLSPTGVLSTISTTTLYPGGIVLFPDDSLYVCCGDYTIQKVAPNLANPGTYTTTIFAGAVNASGYVDGPVANARFNNHQGITVDANYTMYLVDLNNHAIRMITAGNVYTCVGPGASSGSKDGPAATATFLGQPGYTSLFSDPAGNLYLSDCYNGTLRLITTFPVHQVISEEQLTYYRTSGAQASSAVAQRVSSAVAQGVSSAVAQNVSSALAQSISGARESSAVAQTVSSALAQSISGAQQSSAVAQNVSSALAESISGAQQSSAVAQNVSSALAQSISGARESSAVAQVASSAVAQSISGARESSAVAQVASSAVAQSISGAQQSSAVAQNVSSALAQANSGAEASSALAQAISGARESSAVAQVASSALAQEISGAQQSSAVAQNVSSALAQSISGAQESSAVAQNVSSALAQSISGAQESSAVAQNVSSALAQNVSSALAQAISGARESSAVAQEASSALAQYISGARDAYEKDQIASSAVAQSISGAKTSSATAQTASSALAQSISGAQQSSAVAQVVSGAQASSAQKESELADAIAIKDGIKQRMSALQTDISSKIRSFYTLDSSTASGSLVDLQTQLVKLEELKVQLLASAAVIFQLSPTYQDSSLQTIIQDNRLSSFGVKKVFDTLRNTYIFIDTNNRIVPSPLIPR